MVNEPEGVRPESEADEGGPVKTFLEHLEDLRWTLVKSLSAVLIGMVLCLVASNKVVAFLMWPLDRAQRLMPRTNDTVVIHLLGTNVLARVRRDQLNPEFNATNSPNSYTLVPVQVGTNVWLSLQADPRSRPADADDLFVTLKNYGPIAAFVVALQLALYGGLTLSAPFVLFFIGQFVLPALKIHEKKFLYQSAGMGAVLFFLGVAFCYFIIMQVALLATVEFSKWMGFGADEWRADEYISFVCKFMLGMGICFELPVVLLALVKIGLIDYRKLGRFRPYWVVIELFLSAIVTPSGDPLTMLLMAVPIHFLYEISVLIAWFWDYQDRKRAAREPDAAP